MQLKLLKYCFVDKSGKQPEKGFTMRHFAEFAIVHDNLPHPIFAMHVPMLDIPRHAMINWKDQGESDEAKDNHTWNRFRAGS